MLFSPLLAEVRYEESPGRKRTWRPRESKRLVEPVAGSTLDNQSATRCAVRLAAESWPFFTCPVGTLCRVSTFLWSMDGCVAVPYMGFR
jgi:hypothetical protein